jgi:hypothetical protein
LLKLAVIIDCTICLLQEGREFIIPVDSRPCAKSALCS